MSAPVFTATVHNARPATWANVDCWFAIILDAGGMALWQSVEHDTETEARAELAEVAQRRGITIASVTDTTDHAAIAARNAAARGEK